MKEALYNLIAKTGVRGLSKIFPEYFAREPLKPTDRYIEYPFVLRNLPAPPAKVLDVGCVGSYFPLLLSALGYRVYGIDIRDYSIVNEIEFQNFSFLRQDIKKTSFSDGFFDAVNAISTVEHIGLSGRYGAAEDEQGDRKAVDEIKRILKPGGIALLTFPFGKAKTIKPHCRIYDDDLKTQLVKGMKIEKEEYYKLTSNDDWAKVSMEEAQGTECSPHNYSLCLLKLRK